MTTHPNPPATVHLGDPGTLLAALPALLGFHPEHSLVLVCLEGERAGSVGLVARVDLPARSDRAGAAAVVEQLSVLCARRTVPAAVAVVVDDAGPPGSRRHLVRALRTACEAVGTDLVAAHHLPRAAAGAAWSSYGSSGTGLLPDPRSSPVATEHVLRGRVIRGSRAEVDALLAHDGPEPTGRVGLVLDGEHARVRRRRASGAARCSRELLERVVAAVARAGEASAEPLGAEEVAALGAALCDLPVRDACIALAGGAHADAAERLWTELVRALPAPELAEPAVLLAHSAYARGEGPVAGVALQVALEADPAHRMAGLLAASLGAGLEPDSVRALSSTAHGIATELGVTLPPVGWE